jgi:calcineurin-like phosphoesterase family protein
MNKKKQREKIIEEDEYRVAMEEFISNLLEKVKQEEREKIMEDILMGRTDFPVKQIREEERERILEKLEGELIWTKALQKNKYKSKKRNKDFIRGYNECFKEIVDIFNQIKL